MSGFFLTLKCYLNNQISLRLRGKKKKIYVCLVVSSRFDVFNALAFWSGIISIDEKMEVQKLK